MKTNINNLIVFSTDALLVSLFIAWKFIGMESAKTIFLFLAFSIVAIHLFALFSFGNSDFLEIKKSTAKAVPCYRVVMAAVVSVSLVFSDQICFSIVYLLTNCLFAAEIISAKEEKETK